MDVAYGLLIIAIILPGGHVVFGLPSISGANQKKK
jgi:hypothetical protein